MSNVNKISGGNAGIRTGRLAGKTAVITGGAAGMGRATSLAFANEGATVAILDIQTEAGEEVVDSIRKNGGSAEFIETDVSDAWQVDAAFDKIAETVGFLQRAFQPCRHHHRETAARIDRAGLRSPDGHQRAIGIPGVPPRRKRDERQRRRLDCNYRIDRLGAGLRSGVAVLHDQGCGTTTGAQHRSRIPGQGNPL